MLGSGERIGVSAAQAAPLPDPTSAEAALAIMHKRLPSIIAVSSVFLCRRATLLRGDGQKLPVERAGHHEPTRE
jgi:hypothetical protein